MAAQLAVLRDIVQDPMRAVALGRDQGEDLVDVLIRLLAHSSGPIKQAQLLCLMSFDDARVSQFLVAEFRQSRDAASVLHLGKRLSLVRGLDFFRPFLWHEGAAQALAAARFCHLEADLTPKERLRVALLLEEQPPALDETTLELWMQELRGPHRLRVRRLVEQRGQEVLLFWSRYEELAEGERDWLLQLSARLDPEFLKARLPSLLQLHPLSLRLVEQASRLGIQLPQTVLESELGPVRAIGIAAGLADGQLDRFLQSSTAEAIAATGRCDVERLLRLLGDPRWEVRAAATEALSGKEREQLPLQELRSKAGSKILAERVAAVEVLRRIDDSEWLNNLLDEVPWQ